MDKIRIGLIGCGGIARSMHAPALAAVPDIEIAAICDVDEACTAQVADKYGIKQVFSDYREMIEKADIDAVDICTPNFLHLPPALAAFEAGKHVLVEKPIALNADEAKQMVEAGRGAKKKLMVAQCLRFTAENQALKRFIDAGKLGEMYYARVRATRRRGVPAWGFFIDKEKQGGGPLIDIGVHILDLTLWLMGIRRSSPSAARLTLSSATNRTSTTTGASGTIPSLQSRTSHPGVLDSRTALR